MAERIVKEAQVPFDLGGNRFDQIATELFNDYSRSRIQSWIKEGALKVDGQIIKPKEKLFGGEVVTLDIVIEAQEDHEAQEMALDIVYEDSSIMIVNKPAGLVVHPAVGNRDGTLMNAILHHAPETAHIPRAGIVHRLDKETTGLMVVAKTLIAQTDLVSQLQERSMGREYEAISIGVMTGGGVVNEPIGRHPHNRQKQAVEPLHGKDAVTHYRLVERFKNHTHIRLKLETGRTHQIRVHMAFIQYPLIGDPQYGGRLKMPKACTPELQGQLRNFRRQALHAKRLELSHPVTGEWMEWEVDLPDDMKRLLEALKADTLESDSSDSEYF
ncbi:RNA pseudouridine synthase [Marinomonas primoryensis]|jgi:23S rRNA pseudouridine1911/1915/1917 synthase|uniref:Pseudouridine synthase n=1 Tax=Marinomonas primoryensis TaxID=178399 RepID=A0A2Z4PY02_9GAMM|nr:23S rRNA pseudouridine(1911/1915/1917) synthase RluD [Marinomonas primoryensis]AWY01924.1 RNA pseudouridine synthase [Marinomonas primoryensis]QKK81705.1 23S rRNA pseudouridine synthase D [Marinomonas primoryensis]|tara:strand:+ start:668 stop:1651 length:984 start_codon:yes stop_codon:yes gene_type:complete